VRSDGASEMLWVMPLVVKVKPAHRR